MRRKCSYIRGIYLKKINKIKSENLKKKTKNVQREVNSEERKSAKSNVEFEIK